jgi:hypothetical protein
MSITVSNGETYRLHTRLTSADTVTLQPDSLLISNRLNFIAQAGDIILDSASGSESAAALEIKHVAPVVSTEFMSNVLILNYANGLNTALNITGTADNGSIHPYQAGGTFYLAPVTGFTLPNDAHSIPTTFYA